MAATHAGNGSQANNCPYVVVGNFDGVHIGHRAMVAEAVARASAVAGESAGTVCVATFDPHPRKVLTGTAPPMLCTLDQRVALLQALGVDHVEVIPFTRELSRMSPREFVTTWLRDRLHARGVVVGENFRFGHDAAGDVTVLAELGREFGMEVRAFALEAQDGLVISSSRIRALLREGDARDAARMLGRPYAMSGPVIRGAQRGRQLGVPTANLGVDPAVVVPGNGVYAGSVELAGVEWPSAISVGTNPQFTEEGAPVSVEAHLIGYEGPDFYDEQITIRFSDWIRSQGTFPDVDALVARIRTDIAVALGLAGVAQPR